MSKRAKKPSGNADFDEFWNTYPRCIAKVLTKRAYERALKRGHTHAEIMDGLKAYKFSADPEKQPHSTTFLNQDRFQGIIVRAAPTVSGASSRTSWMDKYDNGAGVLPGLGADRVSGSMAPGPGPSRDEVSRYMGDPERCMPSERRALEAKGFVAIERTYPSPTTGPGGFGDAVSRPTGPNGFRADGHGRVTGPVVSGQRGNRADFDEGELPF